MSFTYEDFYLSGFNTGITISGIQKNTPLAWIVTGLKYDGNPVTTGDFFWFTGIIIADSGTLTQQSGIMGYDIPNDDYRGNLVFSVASGLTATGCIELHWNSGSSYEEAYALEGTFYTFSSKGEDAWNIITKANDSVDNADGEHSHASAPSTLGDLNDVDLPGTVNDDDILVYSTESGAWTTGTAGAGVSQLSDLTDVRNITYTEGYVFVADGVDEYYTEQLHHSGLKGITSTQHHNPTGYETISGDYLTTSGTVDDYAYVSGRYTLTSGSYNTHITSSTAHHNPSGYETISGDLETWNYSHNDLSGLNDGTSYEHITQTQKDALHSIYTLEVHDNTKHDPNYTVETGFQTVSGAHSNISGDLVTHKADATIHYVVGDISHTGIKNIGTTTHPDLDILSGNYSESSGDLSDYKEVSGDFSEVSGSHSDVSGDFVTHIHDDRYYTETEIGNKIFEQSSTFPGAPSEGDFHYDEILDSLYRYNAEAEAWIEVGVSNGYAEIIDNLGNHTATENIIMATYKVIGMGDPTSDQDAATKIYVDDFVPYTASDTLQFSNDGEQNDNTGSYTKLKQITCHISGNIRLYWEHYRIVGSQEGATRVYVNGVAVSTVRSAGTTYTSETHDLVIKTGDLLQIYGWALQEDPPYYDTIYVKNMRIKYTDDFVADL